ncbi:hypothetical protein F8388_011309 [Cannabis sativa]|uniref:Uncharacterized protein n=1 Tax=Cannabis sativa TaxID=3483 RepID=A0A7J6FAM8_CANSA|nr:hypothetical protein F8388_011309 [Cannabis sativa]
MASLHLMVTTTKHSAQSTKTISVVPPPISTSQTDSITTTTTYVPTKKTVLCQAGADVTVASVEPQLEVEASGGTKLVVDTSIKNCSNQVLDLDALPV